MKIAVLVSGGVDSSVALKLLREQGHDLVAFYLKIWLEDEMAFLGTCPWEEDLSYVRQICQSVDVPLEIVSLQREYYDRVVDWTISELRQGRTPSPDILCNERVKFGAFLERVGDRFAHVATGHHAQTIERDGKSLLVRGVDPVKDQTYFLCHLQQHQIRQCVFPVGRFNKATIRTLALDWNLANAQRPDSQGICFLGRIPYPDFVEFHLGEKTGNIVENGSGHILGQHRGFWYHTIGQRKGLGLSGGPWYVVAKDIETNRIIVEHKDRLSNAGRRTFRVISPNWITEKPTKRELQVRIRHGEKISKCLVEPGDTWIDVELEEPDTGIASGQFAAIYDDEICLGGGQIE